MATKKTRGRKSASRDGWNMIRGWKTWGHETSKYCFSILFTNDDGETRWRRCFQKKYTRLCPRLSILYFFPSVPFPVLYFFSLRNRDTGCLQISKWKQRSEVKSSQLRAHVVSISLITREKPSRRKERIIGGQDYSFQNPLHLISPISSCYILQANKLTITYSLETNARFVSKFSWLNLNL